MAPAPDRSWQEWVIAICVTALSLFAAWTVFGEDIGHLFQPANVAGNPVAAQPSQTPN